MVGSDRLNASAIETSSHSFELFHMVINSVPPSCLLVGPGGRGLAQGLGIRLFAFGGAYWPLATAHSDPLWVRTCFGPVNGAPGWLVLFDYSGVGRPGDGLLPVPLTRCIQMHTASPCWVC